MKGGDEFYEGYEVGLSFLGVALITILSVLTIASSFTAILAGVLSVSHLVKEGMTSATTALIATSIGSMGLMFIFASVSLAILEKRK